MTADSAPEPLSAKVESSFAYYTINARLPVTLAQVADSLYRKKDIFKTFGQDASDDLKTIIGKVSKLRYEVQTDKPIQPLEGDEPDVVIWNAELNARTDANNGEPPTWYGAPWLYVECYMYRALCDFVKTSTKLQKYDIFADQKQTAYMSSEAAIASLLLYLKEVSTSLEKGEGNGAAELFAQFLQVALWGNKCDLSITQGLENTQKHCILEQLTHLKPNILADETTAILAALSSAVSSRNGQPGRVDIVLDNAGFELVTDLCFAELLLLSGFASSICFHGKVMPWFVSDVTKEDFVWTLNTMGASSNDAIAHFASRWKSRLQDGSWVLKCDHFWTLPYDFSEMKKRSPEMYADLAKADLIFFKGDLNFRKLSGDRQWNPATPFTVCLRSFNPAPLCSLRALKADVVTGLQEGLAEEMNKKDKKWMVNGNWATVLFCGERHS